MKAIEPIKAIWTDADFEDMNWHDCPIYATAFGDNFELLLDIDYIFKWVRTGKTFHFGIAPCTLVFENVYDIQFELADTAAEIDVITRDHPKRPNNADHIGRDTEFDWTLELHQGIISFKAVGYKQYLRALPQLLPGQKIGLERRGGICFDKTAI